MFDSEPFLDDVTDAIEVVSDSELENMEVRFRPNEDEWSPRNPALRITMQSMDSDRSTVEHQDSEASMSLHTSTTTTASSLTSDNDGDNIERYLKQYPDKSRQKIEYMLGHTPSTTPPASGSNTPRKKMSTDVV